MLWHWLYDRLFGGLVWLAPYVPSRYSSAGGNDYAPHYRPVAMAPLPFVHFTPDAVLARAIARRRAGLWVELPPGGAASRIDPADVYGLYV